jgi:membrane dipeptidase
LAPVTTTNPDALAADIHTSLPVVDGHNDLPWRLRTSVDGDLDAADPGGHLPEFHTDISRLLAGGVGGQFWSVYVPADIEEPYRATLSQIALVESMVARDPRLEMARTAADVRRIRATGRIASLLGAEGGHSIEGSTANLAALAERGVRYMTLTHSDTTEWADSATDEPRHGGLSEFGRRIVREMNRLGVMVDVSHVSPATMWAALETSTAPVIASHSNARALADHPRNVPDDLLAEIGRRGGVVMVVFVSGFVVPETAAASIDMFAMWRQIRARLGQDEAAIAAEMERIELARDLDRGTVSDVADHIEHIAAVAGVDAVGIGSDFDGTTLTPEGLENVSCFPAITAELLRRSWSETEIRKVLGDNVLRVMEAAESVARSQ